jgi:hypothetical protein
VFHEEKIKKLVDSPFGSYGVDVCTKFLHYGDFPIYYNYQILGLIKELEGCGCIVDMKIAQQTLQQNPKP